MQVARVCPILALGKVWVDVVRVEGLSRADCPFYYREPKEFFRISNGLTGIWEQSGDEGQCGARCSDCLRKYRTGREVEWRGVVIIDSRFAEVLDCATEDTANTVAFAHRQNKSGNDPWRAREENEVREKFGRVERRIKKK